MSTGHSPASAEGGLARAALDQIGRGPDWSARERVKDTGRLVLIGGAIILATFVFLTLTGLLSASLNVKALFQGPSAEQSWKDFNEGFRTIGTLVTGVAFGIGLVQWRWARYEASFEKHYDRLKLANDRFDEARKSELKQPADPANLQDHLYTMFVFAELDNLEYILEKHCLRHVHRSLVERTLRHFSARCRDPESGKRFRREVRRWVGDRGEDEAAAGYQQPTRKVASFLAEERHAA